MSSKVTQAIELSPDEAVLRWKRRDEDVIKFTSPFKGGKMYEKAQYYLVSLVKVSKDKIDTFFP